MATTVRVTQGIIDDAKAAFGPGYEAYSQCPVAVAGSRAFNSRRYVVGGDALPPGQHKIMYLAVDPDRAGQALPRRAVDRINRFDRDGTMAPFSFSI